MKLKFPKLKKYKIPVPIYKCELEVWIGGTEKQSIAEIKKLGEDLIEDGMLGMYLYIKEKNSERIKHRILWIEKKPDNLIDRAILVHEIMHAVFNILSYKNIKLLTNEKDVYIGSTEEPYCYLFEYLYMEIFKKVK